ncbi:MAG: type II toxin-antitoxin system HicB family antitoxin [Leptospirales bacterium]|nr:type II toxin-antitoxin system HicB family antitoxin [Leptospirales bacterium]
MKQAGIKWEDIMIYYCTVTKEGDEYIAQFPDMQNVATCGFTHDHALEMAKEALEGCLESDIVHGHPIPTPKYKKGYPITVASHIVLALKLRELRGEQSQTDIARKLGLSYQAYQRLENPRKANPTVKTLEKIANIYGRKLNISF